MEMEKHRFVYAAKLRKRNIVSLLARERPNISIETKDGKLLIDYIENDWQDIVDILREVGVIKLIQYL